jgi:hypothetical protein
MDDACILCNMLVIIHTKGWFLLITPDKKIKATTAAMNKENCPFALASQFWYLNFYMNDDSECV